METAECSAQTGRILRNVGQLLNEPAYLPSSVPRPLANAHLIRIPNGRDKATPITAGPYSHRASFAPLPGEAIKPPVILCVSSSRQASSATPARADNVVECRRGLYSAGLGSDPLVSRKGRIYAMRR